MTIFGLFWLLCKTAVAIGLFIAMLCVIDGFFTFLSRYNANKPHLRR